MISVYVAEAIPPSIRSKQGHLTASPLVGYEDSQTGVGEEVLSPCFGELDL